MVPTEDAGVGWKEEGRVDGTMEDEKLWEPVSFPRRNGRGTANPRMAEVDPSPRIVVVYWTVLTVFFWSLSSSLL